MLPAARDTLSPVIPAQAGTQASRLLGSMWNGTIKQPAVYILASQPNGTLYVGVTSALFDRMIAHRGGTFPGFTSRHGVKTLVHYAFFDTMDDAIRREKQLKKWERLWKIRLVEEMNPTWADLFDPGAGILPVGLSGQGAK